MTWLTLAAIAVGFGWLWTRIARDTAIRFGLVDRPDGRRKVQSRPVPLAGGIGVLFGTITSLVVGILVSPTLAEDLGGTQLRFVLSLLASAIVISIVGMLDDRYSLRARYKLAGQLVAAFILIVPGEVVIHEVAFLGWSIELGLLEIPFTMFWFLAAINALNFLDGMDGLLGTVSVIVLAALGTMALTLTANLAVGWIAIAMAGALLGFLRYNLPPASVYLGDCGSMLIGLVIAAVAIKAALKGPVVALVAPTVILTLPIIDTVAAIIRRRLTGRGIAVPDRGHLHHVLQRNGLSIHRSLFLVAILAVIAAGGALISTFLKNDLIAIGSAFAVVLILVLGGQFGNAEYRLVRERAVAVLKRASRGGQTGIETEVRLHGSAEWGEVWRDVTGAAERLNLQTICLDVNAPVWHEDYHVRWDRVGPGPAPFTLWRAEIPLYGHGQAIGRLTVTGPRDDISVAQKLVTLSELVESAELRMIAMAPSGKYPQPLPADATPVPV